MSQDADTVLYSQSLMSRRQKAYTVIREIFVHKYTFRIEYFRKTVGITEIRKNGNLPHVQ